MSKPVMTEYNGIKYSLRPHGFRSRLLILLAAFVVAFGGALLAATSAQAAAGPVYVSVCGDGSTWYVNPDEDGSDPAQGDRRPLATNDGLVFSPKDLIHHTADFTVTSSLVAGTYSANPAPDSTDFFSIEVWNDSAPVGYGTLRWNSGSSKWSVTKGGATTTGTDPAALLFGLGLSTHARSFGVGYTNSPPGTVTTLVSSISFMGTSYILSCPIAPSVSPSPVAVEVPGPTITVTKNVIAPAAVASATPSTSPTQSPSPSPSVSIRKTTPAPTAPGTIKSQNVSGKGGNPLLPWGIGVAAVVGAALAATGATGILRRRRYQGSHHSAVAAPVAGNDEMATDEYSIDDYNPNLGGYSGGSHPDLDETRVDVAPVSDVSPDNTETTIIPPVVEEDHREGL